MRTDGRADPRKEERDQGGSERRVWESGKEDAILSCAERGYRRHAGMNHNVRPPLEHKTVGLMRRHDACRWDETLTASSLQCNLLVCVCVAIV